VPTPGIDTAALAAYFEQAKGSLLGFFDMFAGGALSNLSVFAPWHHALYQRSIILQLLTIAIPHLERLSKEGEAGRRKITQYTRYGTVLLSLIQGFGISVGLENMAGPTGVSIVMEPGWSFRPYDGDYTELPVLQFIMWAGGNSINRKERYRQRHLAHHLAGIVPAGGPAAIYQTFNIALRGARWGIFLYHNTRCYD